MPSAPPESSSPHEVPAAVRPPPPSIPDEAAMVRQTEYLADCCAATCSFEGMATPSGCAGDLPGIHGPPGLEPPPGLIAPPPGLTPPGLECLQVRAHPTQLAQASSEDDD